MPLTQQKPEATVSTFLMFQEGNAQEAMSLYESIFPGGYSFRVDTQRSDDQ